MAHDTSITHQWQNCESTPYLSSVQNLCWLMRRLGIILLNILGTIMIQPQKMNTSSWIWGYRIQQAPQAPQARFWSWRYLFRTPILSDMLLPLLKDCFFLRSPPLWKPHCTNGCTYPSLTKMNCWCFAADETWLPSGNLIYSYWKWQFIVDFPI